MPSKASRRFENPGNSRANDKILKDKKGELAKMILDEFFGAEFEGGRHQARVDMIHGIEADYSK